MELLHIQMEQRQNLMVQLSMLMELKSNKILMVQLLLENFKKQIKKNH
jgi:hypothetical protein